MMEEMKQCKTKLKQIALSPDRFTVVEHIDIMIEEEETERQPGYKRRIMMSHEFKRMSLVDKQIQNFDHNLKLTKDDVTSAVGKTFTGSGRAPNEGKGGVFERGVKYLNSFFV